MSLFLNSWTHISKSTFRCVLGSFLIMKITIYDTRNTRHKSQLISLCTKHACVSISLLLPNIRNAVQTRSRSRFVVLKHNKSSPLRIVPQRIFLHGRPNLSDGAANVIILVYYYYCTPHVCSRRVCLRYRRRRDSLSGSEWSVSTRLPSPLPTLSTNGPGRHINLRRQTRLGSRTIIIFSSPTCKRNR